MKIGELAQRTDSTIRQLRYYDEQGLLGSDLSDNNYCNYDEDTIEQVCQIKNLAEAGLPAWPHRQDASPLRSQDR